MAESQPPASGDVSAESSQPPANLPFNWNVSGVWVVIKERSDGLEKFLELLGVGWAARKLVASVDVVTTIEHTAGRYLLTDKSKLGVSTSDLQTDGVRRMVKGNDGKRAWITARCDSSTGGKVRIDTEPLDSKERPTGTTTTEFRWLESREVLCQTVEVFKDGQSKYVLRRFFRRQETEEERRKAEEEWQRLLVDPGPAQPDPMNLAEKLDALKAKQAPQRQLLQQPQEQPQQQQQPQPESKQPPEQKAGEQQTQTQQQQQPSAPAPAAEPEQPGTVPKGSYVSSTHPSPFPPANSAKHAATPVGTLLALGLVVLLVQQPQLALIIGGGMLAFALLNPITMVQLIGEKEFRKEQERRQRREFLGKAADAMHRAGALRRAQIQRQQQEGRSS